MNVSRSWPCVLVILLTGLVGCGGKNDATGPSNQPYTQTLGGTVSVFGSTYHPLTINRAGQMTLVLTWADVAIDLDLYLAAATCTTNLYPKANCGIVLASDSSTGVRETISRQVNSGETYTIWVDNLNQSRATTYTLNLTIQ